MTRRDVAVRLALAGAETLLFVLVLHVLLAPPAARQAARWHALMSASRRVAAGAGAVAIYAEQRYWRAVRP